MRKPQRFIYLTRHQACYVMGILDGVFGERPRIISRQIWKQLTKGVNSNK